MVEMRWIDLVKKVKLLSELPSEDREIERLERVLQYRQRTFQEGFIGGLGGYGAWTAWQDVPFAALDGPKEEK